MRLLSIFLEYYTCVVASETECVAQCSTNLTLLRLVEGVVEIVIDLRILVVFLVVDGWRNDVVLHCKHRCKSLYCAGSTEKEEEPVENVPTTEQTADDFIVLSPEVEAHAEAAVEALNRKSKKHERRSPMYRDNDATDDSQDAKANDKADTPIDNEMDNRLNLDDKEFDLSHISAREQSREDIIAAAEAAAFGE